MFFILLFQLVTSTVYSQVVDKVTGNRFLITNIGENKILVDEWIELKDSNDRSWGFAKVTKVKGNKATAKLQKGSISKGLRVHKIKDQRKIHELTVLKRSPHRISLAQKNVTFDYKEPGLMSIKGDLSGNGVLYEFRQEGLLQIYYEALTGDNKYDGQTQDGDPVQTTTQDKITTLGLNLGFPLSLLSRFTTTPFVGFASRSWDDKIEGTGGYRREIQYSYLPIGLIAEVNIFSFFTLFASYEYNYFLSGKVKSHLGDAIPGLPTTTNEQKKGKGDTSTLGAQVFVSNFFLRGKIFTQKWKIKESEIATITIPIDDETDQILQVVEPENTTEISGFAIELGYLF